MPRLSHPTYRIVEAGSGQARGPIGDSELVALLDELLAAERAGVKVAAALREDHPPGRIRTLLDVVHIDEAESCRLLADSLRVLGADPGSRIGDFAGKALAIEGARERLAFLQRGQRWIVRRLEATIPRVAHPAVAEALRSMLEIHERNVAACDEVLASPGETPSRP